MKPTLIYQLEKKIGITLREDNNFTKQPATYKLNDKNEIEALCLRDIGVKDFSLIQDYPTLRHLSLSHNSIKDFSFIEGIPNLVYLDISGNNISNAFFISHLKKLNYLALNYNKLCDVDFLEELTALKYLELSDNNITDISVINRLKNIHHLNLRGNAVQNISALNSLDNVTTLDLRRNRIRDLALANKRELKYLFVTDNPLKAISLFNLPKIKDLRLNDMDLTDVSLSEMPSLSYLDLKNNEISNVSFLNQLKAIEHLDISNNYIRRIEIKDLKYLNTLNVLENPVEFLSLRNSDITMLDLSNLNLESLVLVDLPCLNNLTIRSSKLKDISFLKFVKNITLLDLCNSNISELDLEHFSHLKVLYLRKNNITDLSFLRKVPTITDLDIDLNPIDDYRPLKYLPLLEVLKVSNQIPISALSSSNYLREIFLSGSVENTNLTEYLNDGLNFPNLRTIGQKSAEVSNIENLLRCKLTIAFPGSVIDWTENATYSINTAGNITSLCLRRSNVNNIRFITKFKKLEKLDLRINSINDISILQGMAELRELHLYSNKIRNIPLDFFDALPNLYYLNLKNNPIKNIPKEIFDRDENVLNDVKIYLNSLRGEREYLHQAKMILVGNGEVGKSSIRLKLLNKNAHLPGKEERTQGLDIATYNVKNLSPALTKLAKSIDFSFAIWDFGGQGRYREVQQLFCGRKALYIFVTAVDDLPTKEDYVGFEYWLSMAKAFGYDEKESWQSPIIHVVNKCDIGKMPVNEELLSKIFSNIHEYVKISCVTLKGFEQLEHCIRTALPKVSKDIFSNQFSKKWFAVKETLEKKRRHNHITLWEYRAICKKHGLNESESDMWLDYLDRIGDLIYFRDNTYLNDFIVLNPLWVKDSIYKVLDSPLTQKGILDPDWFRYIWADYTGYEHENLLSIMVAYRLCYAQKDRQEHVYYIVPALLPISKPTFPLFLCEFRYDLKFDYAPFIPAGTVNKLIVTLNEYIYQDLKWKNGCVIHLMDEGDFSFAEIVEDWENKAVFARIGGRKLHSIYNLIRRTLTSLLADIKKIKFLDTLEMTTKIKVNGDYVEPKTIISFGKERDYQFLFKSDEHLSKDKAGMKTIKIFLASSSELKGDRDALRLFISVENDRLSEKGIYLKLIQWEYFLDAVSDTRLQDEYNKAVQESDVLLSLFFTKAGQFTEEEFNTAYNSFKQTGKPLIFTYLKNGTVNMGNIDEEVISLLNFKKRLKELGHFPTNYESIDDLKVQFKRQIEQVLDKL